MLARDVSLAAPCCSPTLPTCYLYRSVGPFWVLSAAKLPLVVGPHPPDCPTHCGDDGVVLATRHGGHPVGLQNLDTAWLDHVVVVTCISTVIVPLADSAVNL